MHHRVMYTGIPNLRVSVLLGFMTFVNYQNTEENLMAQEVQTVSSENWSKFCQICENIIMCDKLVFVSWVAVWYWCCLHCKTSVIYDFRLWTKRFKSTAVDCHINGSKTGMTNIQN